ncbi:MAG: HAD-IA family hydrolase [Fimbriiglobus sp.]
METVFIDFGNVIGFFDHSQALRQLVAHSPMSQDALDVAIYGHDAFDDYEAGRLSSEQFYTFARDAGQLTCDQAEFYRCFADIFTRNHEVCDLIPTLANRYKLVLASNTCEAHYERYSAEFADVLRLFAAYGVSFEAGARKPDLQFYTHCQTLTDSAPAKCFFLDDLARNIAAAHEHGWQGLLYAPGQGLADKLRTAKILD